MRFLGNVLATIVGLFVFSMIFFFGIIIIGAIAGSGEDTVSVKNNSVIELDLSKVTLDYAGKTNYKDFGYFEAEHDGVTDILNAIDAAKTDDKIKGISILNNQSQLGLGQAECRLHTQKVYLHLAYLRRLQFRIRRDLRHPK